jgi:hypothetical protein
MSSKTFNEVKINVTFSQATSDVTVEGGNNHASNIDGSTTEQHPHGQDLALALGKIQNWYNNWHSVVWTGAAATVNGHTVGKDVPSNAVFTDTTYSLSGAYDGNTWVTTLTPSTGSATTSTVPTASTSVYGITTLSSATDSTSTTVAATPSAVKSAYDLASGKSTVSFTRNLTSGTKVGTITIDGTSTDLYCQTNVDTKVNMKLGTTTKAYLLGSSTTPTSSNQAVESIADTGVFLTTTAGRLQVGSLAVTSGSYANILTSASLTTADVTQTLPATAGTILNTGTTSFTQVLTSGTKIGTITINGTSTDIYCQTNTNTDTKVNVTKDETHKAYLLGTTTTPTTTAAAVESVADTGVYLSTNAGEIVATNIVSKVNNYTIGGNVNVSVPSDAVFTDTTYTFAEGSTNGKFTVTPSGGTAQSVTIHGLNTAAYQPTTAFVPAKPDSTNDLIITDGGAKVVNSIYLPSYVDDVIECYYDSTAGKIYSDSAKTQEITPARDKIYVDLSDPVKDDGPTYRWSGTTFVSLKSPSVSALLDVIYKSNGVITRKYSDKPDSDLTIYTHPTTAGNKHIPTGGAADQILVYSASGTAQWKYLNQLGSNNNSDYVGSTANAAGTHGLVPAAASGTNGTHYLRADGTWSDDPVIELDILTLNVV